MTTTGLGDVEELSAQALDWLLAAARETEDGLAWSGTASDPEIDPTLYSGGAGVVLALLEGHRHFGDDRFADAALRGARTIAAAVDRWNHCSLYLGLAGMAFALRAVHDRLGGDGSGPAAVDRALAHIRSRFDGTRWSEQFELLGGNAGIALSALALGELDLALLAVTPYLAAAEPTPDGVTWEDKVGTAARFHHVSHGTLGIGYALAAVGRAASRADLVELAAAGAADVQARNEAGPDGFFVPHSDPQHMPALVPRYSYGWCHGPAGDAQAFRLFDSVLPDPKWAALGEQCWHTVVRSGVPARLRPGFWDNSGRCCGTAGVLALACDRLVERADRPDFAEVLAADLAARATVDGGGARWSNVEHRATPSELEPRVGWAQGNSGIIRELLRFVRIGAGRDAAYAVPMPDHLPARAGSGRG
jgi:Lanthionine synthetase C-like protein